MCCVFCLFFFQAEDGIRDLVRSRGLGDVYKRQREMSGESLGFDGRRGNDDLQVLSAGEQPLEKAEELSFFHLRRRRRAN